MARSCNCVTGCNACAKHCRGYAISFPDIQEIRALYKPEKISQHMEKELQGAVKLIIKER